MCINGSENASPVGRAWYRPCSYRHQRRHAQADWTTDQNIVTCPLSSCTLHKLRSRSSVRGGGGEVRSGQLARGRWGQRSSAWGYMSERPDGAVGSAEGPTRSENGSLYVFYWHCDPTGQRLELSRTGWVWVKPDEAITMHFQHQNSNSFRFAIR